jgi:flagellar biosynthesis protein FlhF
MYIKKFEGETLDQVLKAVKMELGPDAIIIKTETNKGIKGALSKKIKITAAIPEEDYRKKGRVDSVLSDSRRSSATSSGSSYGNMSLNRSVRTNAAEEKSSHANSKYSEAENHLANFLGTAEEEVEESYEEVVNNSVNYHREPPAPQESYFDTTEINYLKEKNLSLESLVRKQQEAIDSLNSKIQDIGSSVSLMHHDEMKRSSLGRLRSNLLSLDINESIIQGIIKKAQMTLNDVEINQEDTLCDFAYNELTNSIKVKMPFFSHTENKNKSTITVFVSEGATGQSSMCTKVAALADHSCLIRLSENDHTFAGVEEFFKLEVISVKKISEIVSVCRQKFEEHKNIVVDLNGSLIQSDDVRSVIQSLHRFFGQVQCLVHLSAIHSEIYNRKILSKYSKICDGVSISHLDECLSAGSLINVHNAYSSLPLVFFGTGRTIPKDLELASAKRLISEIFELN